MILLLFAKFCKAGTLWWGALAIKPERRTKQSKRNSLWYSVKPTMLWWGSFSYKAREKNKAIQEKLFGIQCKVNKNMLAPVFSYLLSIWIAYFLPAYFIIQLIFAIIHGSHCTFGTIHEFHCIISTNFYLYLQYF